MIPIIDTHEIYVTSHITGIIRERLEYCLRSAGRNSPSGLIIEGPTGVGKTTTCARIQIALNKKFENDNLPPPIYIVQSPTMPSTKEYYSEILAALGDHSPYSGTQANLKQRLFKQLEHKQVKVLIFDEFQQLVEKRGPKVVRQTLDDIKLIADRFKISCVFVGTSEVGSLPKINEQAASRYSNTVSLNYMQFNTEKQQVITRKFMSAFFKAYNLTGLNMESYEAALRMYAATNGDLRVFVHLLDDASGFLTDHANSKPVTLKALSRSYRFLVREVRKTKVNPFTANIESIENELKVENYSDKESEQA